MTVTTTVGKNATVAADYLRLVRRFPLRPIKTAAAHKRAMAMVRELNVKGEAMTNDEGDYLEALALLIADYERRSIKIDKATPQEVLAALMDARDMTPAQLGDVIGSRPAATMVLKGQRELSKAQIRKVAEHFNVSAALFI